MSRANRVYAFLMILFMCGCLGIPKPPGHNVILSSSLMSQGMELNEFNHKSLLTDEGRRHGVQAPKFNHNLIFVALDESIQKNFEPLLARLYSHGPNGAPPRIEEIAWWALSPKFSRLYDNVIRIHYDSFSNDTLLVAIHYFETLNVPYDLMLLTHGLPNHIATSAVTSAGKREFFSWKELGELKGKLHSLRMVYMSSCFSSTLAPDWVAAGAREVISFKKFNSNYFYPFLFVENLNASNFDTVHAYEITNQFIKHELHRRLYRTVIEGMLSATAFEKYLEALELPEFYAK